MEKNSNKKERILVGLWDCPYCGIKGLNGLVKQCPNCGHPQDEGTKFYLGEQREYLDDEKAADYGKGADWTCAFCGALNRYNATECSGCGASREDSTGDYFENEKKQEEKAKRRQAEIDAASPQITAPAPKTKKPFILLAVLAALIGLLVFIFAPRKGTASVSAKEWTRVIYTQTYEDVQRTGWTLPADATLLSSSEQIHHYDSVLTGYADKEETRTRQVIDHYDQRPYTVNNGDGTFTERYEQVPVYRTEYYTETVRVPVYAQVPVYQTQYVYVHKEWVDSQPVTASGTTEAPAWPAFTETPTYRASAQTGSYQLTLTGEKDKVYTLYVSEDIFTGLSIGDTVEIKTSAGTVTEINGVKVN